MVVIRLKSGDGGRIDNVLDLSQITTGDPRTAKKYNLDENWGLRKSRRIRSMAGYRSGHGTRGLGKEASRVTKVS